MQKAYEMVLKNISKKTGLTINEIKNMTPREQKIYLEKKNNKKIHFTSRFPFIGRGNILRDGIRETEDINSEIDKILGL